MSVSYWIQMLFCHTGADWNAKRNTLYNWVPFFFFLFVPFFNISLFLLIRITILAAAVYGSSEFIEKLFRAHLAGVALNVKLVTCWWLIVFSLFPPLQVQFMYVELLRLSLGNCLTVPKQTPLIYPIKLEVRFTSRCLCS